MVMAITFMCFVLRFGYGKTYWDEFELYSHVLG